MVSIVVATAQNNVIGNDNDLIWHLPADLKHFKSVTSGSSILMGRKTYESIGRPLPKRENIIITRQTGLLIEGCIVVNSLQEAINKAESEEVFIIGGVIIGMVTSLVGPIAFVGIAVPNLVKIIRKTVDHQRIGFSVFLLGGAFSVLADLLSRGVLFSDVLPVNAMQCILAFPVIVVLLFNKRKRV